MSVKQGRPVAAISALIAGVGIGAVLMSAAEAPGAAAGSIPSGLRVVSTWSGGMPRMQLASGSLRGDSGRGFVLLQTHGMQPVFFSTPEGAGSLRLVSSFGDGWTFQSQAGSLAIVSFIGEGPDGDPSFTFLGRRLDPANLGAIGARGIAIPVAYGPWAGTKPGMRHRTETAVALVAQTSAAPGWKLLGYLAGFSLPGGMSRLDALQRPLLGPDGRLYSISPKSGRLVSLARAWRNPPVPLHPKFGCSTWPAAGGATYRACANSIVRRGAGGRAVTLLRRHVQNGLAAYTDWGLVSPSPDGKWLLLEDQMSSCGTATWADFLPAGGGQLVRALPQAFASEALGWLPDNSALVAGQTQGCAGGPPAGIYQVWPGSLVPAPQLVLAANAEDATTWGFGR
jgi:hypothetical protein